MLTFPDRKTVREVQIAFSAELWKRKFRYDDPLTQLVKDFDIILYDGDQEVKCLRIKGNYQHNFKAVFEEIPCSRICLKFHDNYGSPYTEVFSVKVF